MLVRAARLYSPSLARSHRRLRFSKRKSDIQSPGAAVPRLRHDWTAAVAGGLVGGLVAGGVVVGSVYGWYHLSGLKHSVDGANSALVALSNAQGQVGKQPPSQVLRILRPVCKILLPYIPGAGLALDGIFDVVLDSSISSNIDAHAKEANRVIQKAIYDMFQATKGGESTEIISTKQSIASISERLLDELTRLGTKVGPVSIADQLELEKRFAELRSLGGITAQTVGTKAYEASATLGRLSGKLELDKRVTELKSTTASIADAVVSKAPEVGRQIRGAASKAKDFVGVPEVSKAVGGIAEKAKSLIFPKSDK